MKAKIAVAAFALVLVLAGIAGYFLYDQYLDAITSTSVTPSAAAAEAHPSVIYGRVTTTRGEIYEGRLRWGRDQEAFWGDYFNGIKDENPWAAQVPGERLSKPEAIEIFGIKIAGAAEGQLLERPFMTRFGDIARVGMIGSDVRVTLKSGTVFNLDYYRLNDFDDGVRVWDGKAGVVDLSSAQIQTIELFSSPRSGGDPGRLHGTVRTRQGDFTGFIQWNRNKGVASDEIDGRTADGELRLRFGTIRSIERRSGESSKVTLLDGREIVVSDTAEAGKDNLGIYVDDQRYGRVLISWDAFERVDFSRGGSGPTYDDFPPGQPLKGTVTTRDGRRLTGRLVYDLDESETTETLDAPSQGVDYTIFFGLINSIGLPSHDEPDQRARVMLHSGETLLVETTGDLDTENEGMLIFVTGSKHPEYVLWSEVQQIEFERPPVTYPPGPNAR